MLLSTNRVTGQRLAARDGEIGEVSSLLFDDQSWTVRYVVGRTMRWLGREVLLAPGSLGPADPDRQALEVRLTRDQIKSSPRIESDAPVSRQHLTELHHYYDWPVWWGAPGAVASIPVVTTDHGEPPPGPGDPHLRSTAAVGGMHVAVTDGEIGHVDDFVLDGESWRIRFLVVDTRNWLPGRRVLVPPAHVREIDWPRRVLAFDLTREQVKGSPEYDPQAPFDSRLEQEVHDYYGGPAREGRVS